MTSWLVRARSLSAVSVLTVVLVASSRAQPAPSAREIHERWRKRLPAQVEKQRQAYVRWRAAGAVPAELGQARADARRRSLASGRAAAGLTAVPAPFHSGGAEVCEPRPVNPLLDPLSIFDDETGEQPPVGVMSRFFFVDWDGDGDLDVFVGAKYNELRYLENVGSPTDPVYSEVTGAASPVDGLVFETGSGAIAPAVVDVDGDDDLDLFVGTDDGSDGIVLFYENDGGVLTRDDPGNPLAGFTFGFGEAAPHFVDWDDDDDLDVFVGSRLGGVDYLRNDGDATNPSFSDQTGVVGVDPLEPFSFSFPTVPVTGDLDGDGDLDVFVGNYDDIRFFRNDLGVLTAVTGYANPFAGSLVIFAGPVLVDLDADGDLDAFIGGGNQEGIIHHLENTGTALNPDLLSTGNNLELFDFDGDGDLDAFVGLHLHDTTPIFAGVGYFENSGSPADGGWALRSGADNPFSTFNAAATDFHYAPALGDVDGDGLLEVFVGADDGYLQYLELNPVTGQFDPGAHALETVDFGAEADPHLADLDGDGELDLVVGHRDAGPGNSFVSFFLNPPGPVGLGTVPDLVLDLGGAETGPAPTLADVDEDGDLDLLIGDNQFVGFPESRLRLIPNTGDPNTPAFDVGDLQELPLQVELAPSPAAGDVDDDGHLDLYVGVLGSVVRFETVEVTVLAAPSAGLTTTEGGGTDAFDVVLDRRPAGTVIVDVASTDLGEGTPSPTQLTFGPTDWDVPQTVTLTGVDDLDPDGPQPYTVALTIDAASDDLPCLVGTSVEAVNLDDEAPALEADKSVTGGDLEAGGDVTYTVTVENVGTAPLPDDADSPEFTDTLPPELTLTGATATGGTVTTSGDTVRWDGALGVGGSVEITIEAAISPAAGGATVSNQGTVFFDTDGDEENDAEAPTDDPDTPEAGDPTVFVVESPVSVVEIPTLSQWGAALLAGLLSLLGALGLRRREAGEPGR